MINEKLNEIELDLKIVQSLVKNNDYIKKVEDHCNKFNYREEKIRELQERIDKAVEYINMISKTVPSSPRKDYAKMILINYEDLLNILKGE